MVGTILVGGTGEELEALGLEMKNRYEIQIKGKFERGEEAVRFAEENRVDLAVIQIAGEEADGIQTGIRLRKLYPEVLLIFLAQEERDAIAAYKLHPVAFLLQPCQREELLYALESARLLSKRRKGGVRIYARTFGHFDIFVNEQPIMFRSSKAKELLALLVDRQGGTVNTDQIICALWEERPNDEATQNLCSKVSRSLKQELGNYGIGELLITSRGVRRVDTVLFECDLYDLLNGEEQAKKQFVGEYMSDYSWAEDRIGQLSRYASNEEGICAGRRLKKERNGRIFS